MPSSQVLVARSCVRQACFLESDEDNGTPKVILTALETFMQDHPRSRRSQYWKENESGKTSSTEQGSMQRDGATSNEIPSNIGVLNGHFPKRISSPKPPPYRAFPESVQQKTRPRASIQEYQSLEIEQTAIMTPWSYVSEDIPRTPKPLSQLSPVKIQTVHKSHVPHHRPASTDLQQTPGDGPPRSPTPLSRAISEGNEKPPGPHPLRCSLDIQRPPRSPKPRSTEASEEIQRPPRPSSLRLSLELQRPPRSPTPPPRGASEEIQRPHVSFWIGDSSESQRSEPAAQEQFLVDPGGGVSSIVSSAEAHTSAPEPQRLPVELERGLRNFQLLPEHFVSTSNARQQNALSAVPE